MHVTCADRCAKDTKKTTGFGARHALRFHQEDIEAARAIHQELREAQLGDIQEVGMRWDKCLEDEESNLPLALLGTEEGIFTLVFALCLDVTVWVCSNFSKFTALCRIEQKILQDVSDKWHAEKGYAIIGCLEGHLPTLHKIEVHSKVTSICKIRILIFLAISQFAVFLCCLQSVVLYEVKGDSSTNHLASFIRSGLNLKIAGMQGALHSGVTKDILLFSTSGQTAAARGAAAVAVAAGAAEAAKAVKNLLRV